MIRVEPFEVALELMLRAEIRGADAKNVAASLMAIEEIVNRLQAGDILAWQVKEIEE